MNRVIHAEPHPMAGKTVKLTNVMPGPDLADGATFWVEDWWDRAAGMSWMDADGNRAALNYAFRNGINAARIDNEVVYGKDERGIGHIVHVDEIEVPSC